MIFVQCESRTLIHSLYTNTCIYYIYIYIILRVILSSMMMLECMHEFGNCFFDNYMKVNESKLRGMNVWALSSKSFPIKKKCCVNPNCILYFVCVSKEASQSQFDVIIIFLILFFCLIEDQFMHVVFLMDDSLG